MTPGCRDLLNDYGKKVAARAFAARGMSRLPAPASRSIIPVRCPRNAFLGAFCGRVRVPLDRQDPSQGTIPIAFELYTHTGRGAAQSAILMNFGGPGGGTTPSRDGAFYLFANNLESHDLLLIDDRGRGFSRVIDCPKLQGAVGRIAGQVAECADILAPNTDEYGTGDVAKDTNAVRKAIGYDLVDYYGVSYGGADVTAFATRFPNRVRSLILDAPWGDTEIVEEITDVHLFVKSTLRQIRLICRRSPTCDSELDDPVADYAYLVDRVRDEPIVGSGIDAFGSRVRVRIDPKFVVEYLMLPSGFFVNNSEISAAANALRRDDTAPLLRLAAEAFFPICCLPPGPDFGPPRDFSLGSFVATFCVDNQWEWDFDSPIAERKIQHEDALSSAPQDLFFPFTGPEAADSTFVGTPYCIRWPKPEDPSPIARPNADYPDVPTLVIGGDIDNQVPIDQTRMIADKFPGSELVEFKHSGHGAAFSGPCASRLITRFINTSTVGNTDCARKVQEIIPAVGEFPERARAATPAKPDPGGGAAGKRVSKVAAVAAATVRDVMQRASMAFFGPGRVIQHGLRGGRIETKYKGFSGGRWVIDLTNVKFAKDVVIDGRVISPPNQNVESDLEISGLSSGHLSISAARYPRYAQFRIRGRLDGQRIKAHVPQI
jgi:pimeloyl-ACP methyl ester carboxylesterase